MIPFGFRIGIGVQIHTLVFSLHIPDDPSGDQIHLRGGTGEVQIFAAVEQRRAGRTDMDLLRSAGIQEFRGFPQLRAAHDGIVDQEHAPVLDQVAHRDQLHFGDQVPLALDGGHEGTGPGGRIFDERTGEGNARSVRVADGMGRSRIRNAGHDIRGYMVAARHGSAAVIPHFFHADPFVGGGRIAIVDPEEGADLHILARLYKGFHPFRRDNGDLSRTQLPHVAVAQVQIGKAFKGNAVGVVLLANRHRGAAKPVPCGVDALRR